LQTRADGAVLGLLGRFGQGFWAFNGTFIDGTKRRKKLKGPGKTGYVGKT
jgi:hypothetical protein